MTENPGGTPPRDDEPDAAAAPPPPEPPRPPVPDEPDVPATVPPGGAVPPSEPAAPPVAPPAPAQAPPAPPVYPPAGGQQYPPAGGTYPPPAGGYPPPPAAGGYPPPPASGYGAPGASQYPPPPPGQYGPPAGGYPPPSAATPLSEALSYGWNKFTQNGGTFIGAGLLWILGAGVVGTVIAVIFGSFGSVFDSSNGFGRGFSLSWIVLSALWALLGFVVEAVFIRAALRVTYGRPIKLGDFFDFADLGPVVLAALLLAGINLVLGLVTWIPVIGFLVSVAVNFFLFFTLFFVIDKRLQPVDAIRASVDLIRANLASTVLFVLVSWLIIVAGFVLCFVGAFVAIPVVLLASAYFYRRLLGEPIAP